MILLVGLSYRNAISLSLRFNNGARHHLTVTTPPGVYTPDACTLIGVNPAGEKFNWTVWAKPC